MASNDVNSLKTARPTEGCRSVHESKDDPEMQLPSPFKNSQNQLGSQVLRLELRRTTNYVVIYCYPAFR